MLPSLPNVTSFKKSDSTNETDDCVESNEVSTTNVELEEEENVKDNMEDINALMVASSTIKNNAKKAPSGSEKKKLKLRKEFISHITLLSPEDPSVINEKANSYVQAFYDKVQERLEVHEYHQFMQVLNNFDYRLSSTTDLYNQICKILLPKYQDIADEFLTFLTPIEAKNIGKSRPHFMFRNMSLFLQKLGIYFKDQPSQLKKVYRSLTELASCVDASMDLVKATILPLLKGNTLLIDWFLQIFPGERPPESLISGPWETVDVNSDPFTNGTDEIYETVVIPDFEDQYGGQHCICNCHDSENNAFKLRHQHCMPCGKKFLQGRVYVQTGKGLRLAHVTFDSNQEEHMKRLCGLTTTTKKRPDGSPTKHSSPLKDSQEENNDTDDETNADSRRKTKAKTPRKRKLKIPCDKEERPNKKIKATTSKTNNKNKSEGKDSNIFTDKPLECNEIFEEIYKELDGTDGDNENEEESNKSSDPNSSNENNACLINNAENKIVENELESSNSINKNVVDDDNNKVKEIPHDEISTHIEEIELDYEHTDAEYETEGIYSDVEENDAEKDVEGNDTDIDGDGDENDAEEGIEQDITENDIEESLVFELDSCGETEEVESIGEADKVDNNEQVDTNDDSEDEDSLSLTQSPNPNHSENSNSNTFEEITWTRDEDKIILLTIREMGSGDEAINHISKQLENKSIEQIETRFNTLITLLQEMAASQANDSN